MIVLLDLCRLADGDFASKWVTTRNKNSRGINFDDYRPFGKKKSLMIIDMPTVDVNEILLEP